MARVSQFNWYGERAAVFAVDQLPGVSPTLYAAKKGYADVLEARLILGADANQEDGYGGTCLMASASYAKLECTRLLIAHGGDVSYAYPGDNAGILYMLALCFRNAEEDAYQEGDYVATADLLIAAGAPIDTRSFDRDGDDGDTALELLQDIEVDEEQTKKAREHRGLIDLLEQRYWREHGGHNPFFRRDQSPSPEDAAQLLTQGAANYDTGHRLDITRVRSSIEPCLRKSVVDILKNYQNKCTELLVLMLLAAGNHNDASPLGILCGHEQGILSLVADFAHPPNVREAIHVLTEVLGIPDDESPVNVPMTTREQLERIDEYDGV